MRHDPGERQAFKICGGRIVDIETKRAEPLRGGGECWPVQIGYIPHPSRDIAPH
jgi:hypothetical protein